MSNLTMSDVAEYFTAFQAKYGHPCTLSIDAIEEVLNGTEDDDIEVILPAMLDAMKPDGQEVGPKHDDRSDDALPVSSSAFEYADAMDDELAMDLETSSKAALEGKRGGAVIAMKLISLHTADTIVNVWPEPGSEGENGTAYIGNRAADYYKTVITKDDGSSSTGERSWYRDYIERSKVAAAPMMALKSIKAVAANEQAKFILPEHEAVRGDKLKIKSKRSAIDGDLTNKKNALVRAVSLIKRMAFLNEKTEFGCEIMLEPSENDPAVMVPVKSNKLVQVWNNKDRRVGNVLTIGQLLALKAVEGGTYAAITGTTQRKPKGGTGAVVQNIAVDSVAKFDDGMAAFAMFFDKLVNDAKATNALLTHLNSAGTDDLLLSMNAVMNGIDGYLSKPGIAKRLKELLADGNRKVA